MQRTRWTAVIAITAAIGSLLVAVGGRSAAATGAPEGSNSESVDVGMPFTGKWAYNVHVNPPYTDTNSSHPSVHHTPGNGDWGTDLYAAPGAQVRLRLSNVTGALSFSWWATSTSCGSSTGINIAVDGVSIGRLYFAHLDNAVRSGAITNGMVLGTVADRGCNPGRHIHLEVTNTTNYACWTDLGNPGVTVSDGASIGRLGSNNNGVRQACTATPPPPPDFDGDGIIDSNDRCPTSYGSQQNQGCPPAGEGGGNAASWAPDRLDAFITGTDSRMWHTWVDGSGWHAFEQDPTPNNPPGNQTVRIASQVAATSFAPGRLDLFARSSSGQLLHKWFLLSLGWSRWENLGGCIRGAPTVASWGPNRLDVFARWCESGRRTNLYHRQFDGTWHPWEQVPRFNEQIASPPSAVSWGPDRIDVFARGSTGAVVHTYFNGTWQGMDTTLGGCIKGQPAVSSWVPGRLDLFVRNCAAAPTSNVSHRYYDGAWQAWEVLPLMVPGSNHRVSRVLGAVSSGVNRIDLFARRNDGVLVHKWYDGNWSVGWEELRGPVTVAP